VHDQPSGNVLGPLLEAVKSYSYDGLDRSLKSHRWFEVAKRKDFRRGGEWIDNNLAESLDSALASLVDIPRGELCPVWSESNRDWRTNIVQADCPEPSGR
jgi:hypothetical protein